MEKKIVCAFVYVLLGLFFINNASAQGAGGLPCSFAQIRNITNAVQEIGRLSTDAANAANITLSGLRECFGAFVPGSNAAGSGGPLAGISSCITFVASTELPTLQRLLSDSNQMIPLVTGLLTTLNNCINPPSTSPPPPTTARPAIALPPLPGRLG